jgi:hypothetical protein
VISEAALLETWQPHTPTGNGDQFGLGWIVGPDYRGRTQLGYSGGNLGFSSYVSLLPDADLGVAVLTNVALASPFLHSVSEYVYETAFGLEHTADAAYQAESDAIEGLFHELASTLEPSVDSAAFAAIAGRYEQARVQMNAESQSVMSTAFGDFLLYPVMGMEQTYVIESALGALATFQPSPEGGMGMTITFLLGEPQPPVTYLRVE